MRILQVIPYFFLSWAPDHPVELVLEMSRSLVRAGHEVSIYTTNAFNRASGCSEVHRTEIDGVRIHEFPSYGRYPLSFSSSLATAVRSEVHEFQVVHIHEYRTFEGTVASFWALGKEVPYVVQAHGSLRTEIGKTFLKGLYDVAIGRRVLHHARYAIALTAREARQYEAFGIPSSKVAIIPQGVEFSEYVTLPPRGMFRELYGIPEDANLVSYLGRLDMTKGLDLLIESFSDLSKQMKHVVLAIIGRDCGYESHLKNLVSDLGLESLVVFTGFVQKEEKASAYVDSDVLVTPSYNGFPRTFLEACASGTPIITTERGDKLDWIEARAGLVVAYDRCSLTQAMAKVLNDDKLRYSLQSQARNLARDTFDWSVVVKQLEAVYEQAILGCPSVD